jgi:hypothetical protein
LNKANGKLEEKPSIADDAKSETNVQLHQPIDIVRPASTDGIFLPGKKKEFLLTL